MSKAATRPFLCLLGLALALVLTGCGEGPDEPVQGTPVARATAGAPTAEGVAPAAAPATAAATPVLLASGEPVSVTLRALDASAWPDLAEARWRPGPWSPSGEAMVAGLVQREGPEGPAGRIWTLAVPPPPAEDDGAVGGAPVEGATLRPVWDSGDVEGPLRAPEGAGSPAAWLRDGTLALARADRTLVGPDGTEAAIGLAGLEGAQPRALTPGPNGRALFLVGPRGAWLAADEGPARPVTGLPAAPERWAWRVDSGALVVAVGDELFAVDPGSAAAEKIAELPALEGGDEDASERASEEGDVAPRSAPPLRWLAGGRVLPATALPLEGSTPTAWAYRMIDVETTRAEAVHEAIGLAPAAAPLAGAEAWVSPDGHYLVYPEVVDEDGTPATAASWLYDARSGEAERLEPLGPVSWSPDGLRFAWAHEGRLMLRETADGERLALSDELGAVGEDLRIAWSPDGAWLLFQDAEGGLQLVRADGARGPSRLAADVLWDVPPTWSPDARRFAAVLRDEEGAETFVVATIEDG